MLWYHSNKVGGLLLPFLAQSSLRSTATIMRCSQKNPLGQTSLIKPKGSFEKGSSIEQKAAFSGSLFRLFERKLSPCLIGRHECESGLAFNTVSPTRLTQ